MSEYFINGEFDESKMGHGEAYYAIRHTWIDARGSIKISPTSYWGFCNKIITQTHSIDTGMFHGPALDAGVIVDDEAWITSFCILHNCHVEHHGIVSMGAVVNKIVVPSYTIVAGNPAKIVAEWDGKKWMKYAGRDWNIPRMGDKHEGIKEEAKRLGLEK